MPFLISRFLGASRNELVNLEFYMSKHRGISHPRRLLSCYRYIHNLACFSLRQSDPIAQSASWTSLLPVTTDWWSQPCAPSTTVSCVLLTVWSIAWWLSDAAYETRMRISIFGETEITRAASRSDRLWFRSEPDFARSHMAIWLVCDLRRTLQIRIDRKECMEEEKLGESDADVTNGK